MEYAYVSNLKVKEKEREKKLFDVTALINESEKAGKVVISEDSK